MMIIIGSRAFALWVLWVSGFLYFLHLLVCLLLALFAFSASALAAAAAWDEVYKTGEFDHFQHCIYVSQGTDRKFLSSQTHHLFWVVPPQADPNDCHLQSLSVHLWAGCAPHARIIAKLLYMYKYYRRRLSRSDISVCYFH